MICVKVWRKEMFFGKCWRFGMVVGRGYEVIELVISVSNKLVINFIIFMN